MNEIETNDKQVHQASNRITILSKRKELESKIERQIKLRESYDSLKVNHTDNLVANLILLPIKSAALMAISDELCNLGELKSELKGFNLGLEMARKEFLDNNQIFICPVCFKHLLTNDDCDNHSKEYNHAGFYKYTFDELKKIILKQIITKVKPMRIKIKDKSELKLLNFLSKFDWDEMNKHKEIPELVYNQVKNKISELKKSIGEKT